VALRFSTDVLSGIPSIVVGLFAYAVIVVPMAIIQDWPVGSIGSDHVANHHSDY